MRLVLLGLPGAGKGTQGELLAQEFQVPHISTGAIFRHEIETKTELGKKALQFMDRGELVPDEVTVEMVKSRLNYSDCTGGFVLDGFPRNVPQARALDEAFANYGMTLDAAIHIEITKDEAFERIFSRLVCQQCEATYSRRSEAIVRPDVCPKCGGSLIQRSDDTKETVENRLRVYVEQTSPVVAYYQSRGNLVPIDGRQSVNDVFSQIVHLLRNSQAAGGTAGVGQ